ncbi:MAG: thioredoxin family protein [Caldisericia bacterium]
MKIQVLGTGHCGKCALLYDRTLEAVKKLDIDAEVVKIDDLNEIISMGVMSTPGLAIDGKVVSSGKIIGTDRVVELIKMEI